jgi:hypothetical protein
MENTNNVTKASSSSDDVLIKEDVVVVSTPVSSSTASVPTPISLGESSINKKLKAWIDAEKITPEEANELLMAISTESIYSVKHEKEDTEKNEVEKTGEACLASHVTGEDGDSAHKTSQNSFVYDFKHNLYDMLCSLGEAFLSDEEPALHEEIKTIKEMSHEDYDLQVTLVKDWHSKVSGVYKRIRLGEEDSFLESLNSVDVLKRIGFTRMYTDPGTTNESKNVLLKYITSLNRDAALFHGIPQGVMDRIDSISESCDPSKMSVQDMVDMAQKTWKSIKPEEMRDVGAAIPGLLDAMGGESGISAMMQQYMPPGMDVGNIFDLVKSMGGLDPTASGGSGASGISTLMSTLASSGLDLGTIAGMMGK